MSSPSIASEGSQERVTYRVEGIRIPPDEKQPNVPSYKSVQGRLLSFPFRTKSVPNAYQGLSKFVGTIT